MQQQRIGFIGAGAMASAIVRRLVANGYPVDRIMVSDLDEARRFDLAHTLGIGHTGDNTEAARWADLVILAVKPHVVLRALPEIASFLEGKALVSIAAGVSTARLQELAGPKARALRAMPNTPAQVGEGVTSFSLDHNLTDDELAAARAVFESVGTVVMVEERLMSAVTALAGSGPALPYLLIETMADAGVRMGLPRRTAMELSAQTVLGAAVMQRESEGRHPAQLRDDVCSPGGSTIELVEALEACGFRHAIHEALARCKKRVEELG